MDEVTCKKSVGNYSVSVLAKRNLPIGVELRAHQPTLDKPALWFLSPDLCKQRHLNPFKSQKEYTSAALRRKLTVLQPSKLTQRFTKLFRRRGLYTLTVSMIRE